LHENALHVFDASYNNFATGRSRKRYRKCKILGSCSHRTIFGHIHKPTDITIQIENIYEALSNSETETPSRRRYSRGQLKLG